MRPSRRCFIQFCAFGALAVAGCRSSSAPAEVVVYTSVDQVFSEPVFQTFEEESGIRMGASYPDITQEPFRYPKTTDQSKCGFAGGVYAEFALHVSSWLTISNSNFRIFWLLT